jgi:osmotically-inducible protein OsmY
MADRDRHDWERGREYRDRERDYGRGSDRERGDRDRGMMSRSADEVRSWFGDEDARRRRELDDERGRQWRRTSDRDYGANSDLVRSEHGWGRQRVPQERGWESHRPPHQSHYGDQRDFVGRQNEGPYTEGSRWGGGREFGDETRRGDWQRSISDGRYASGLSSPSFAGSDPRGNEGGFQGQGWQYSGPSSGGGFSPGMGSFAGRGPRNYQRSDERIREEVNERLTADPRIDASDIDIRVQDGEVTLTGMVSDGRTRRLAEEVVEDLHGVRDVRNDLRVNRAHWEADDESRHRRVGEQSRGLEDGSIGHTGDPQTRDDVTTVNSKESRK